MSLTEKISALPKAYRQLGPETIWLYAKYQLKLRSGWLRLQTSGGKKEAGGLELQVIVRPANKRDFEQLLGERLKEITKQADEILRRQVWLFGAEPRALELQPPAPPEHWTRTHSHLPDGRDIKPVWEAGRFSWATVLARAYWVSGEDQYAEGFWNYFEEFCTANPPNKGPHWSSAQEVALRLIAWAFCYGLIADSPSSSQTRKVALSQAVVAHAERIPPTIDYARAQSNNHLLSEALGLVTAAALVPDFTKATKWKTMGWALFHEGIEKQIHDDGSYAQHSSNYHRVLLQLGLWAKVLSNSTRERLPEPISRKLAKAKEWLLTLLDESGRVPNLGPNDGAYILPLCTLPFEDYRPTLRAARVAFSGVTAPEEGVWGEMALWLGLKPPSPSPVLPQSVKTEQSETGADKSNAQSNKQKIPLRIEGKNTWAYLRATEFKERPGHADQLHLDIWWRGLNIAGDAGSYLYTAPEPWDNAMASARVHNTITVDEREPMTRIGRFLWLDWDQAKVVSTVREKDGRLIAVEAEHDGYRRQNVIHRREVKWDAGRWVITDRLLPIDEKKKPVQARLHWLLPDWDWQVDRQEIRIESPYGMIEIAVDVSIGDLTELRLIRAGELVHGSGTSDPILGWASPTYGIKVPALSFIAGVVGPLPITIISTWMLPK